MTLPMKLQRLERLWNAPVKSTRKRFRTAFVVGTVAWWPAYMTCGGVLDWAASQLVASGYDQVSTGWYWTFRIASGIAAATLGSIAAESVFRMWWRRGRAARGGGQ